MGGANPDYYTLTHPDEQGRRERHWGDQWHYAASRLVVACRAYGLRPIDGPVITSYSIHYTKLYDENRAQGGAGFLPAAGA